MMESSDSERSYLRFLRARDRVNKAIRKHSLAKQIRKEIRMRAGGSAGPCSSSTSTRGQKKNLVCFEEANDKCVSQSKTQCKGESANTCPAHSTPMHNQCQLKRECENSSCQCQESCQCSQATKCQCKKPQKSAHCCQCNEPPVRPCHCNDKASQTPCVVCECKREPKRSCSCQFKETDEENEVSSKSSKKDLKEEKKKRKKDEKKDKKVAKKKNSDRSKRAKKHKEDSDNDDACSCCSCEEETVKKSSKKKTKSGSATPNSSDSSRRRWSCKGRSTKKSTSNKGNQRQQISANSKKKTQACSCCSCEEPKPCDCCSCQSATCSCHESTSCCEESPVCQQEENVACGSSHIQKPCTDCSMIPEISQQICELQKRLELKAKEDCVQSELLKDICSKVNDLSCTVKTLTKQCKEQSKMMCPAAALPPPKPPCQPKCEPCPKKKVSSTCQFCCDKNLPVLNDLKCALLDVIGKRQFDDVVLTILLRADNVYHVNIKDINNGSVLGCLLVNDVAIKDANKFGLFKQVLTFFMIDVRNTLKPCESVFGITFEYVKEKRQCGGSLSIDCQKDVAPRGQSSVDHRNIIAEIFGLPLKNLSEVYSTTHACTIANVRAKFFDHHLKSSSCNYDSQRQPHKTERKPLLLKLKKCDSLKRIVPIKCDKTKFFNRIESLLEFAECDSKLVLTDDDLGYPIREIEVTSLSDIELQSSR
ncbi:uncharacterized protein LOC26529621 isoform X2 [Drosophila willistoni]|uniref:uncharacterized protein LOC26529621 isoform X2 n=1 Tax=Drosophila willistoni TaxID=7260 RepID=UPI000C26D374|nr:uncharacterized protein LOC26529621 isoform X2 [Drosophila willistoni]